MCLCVKAFDAIAAESLTRFRLQSRLQLFVTAQTHSRLLAIGELDASVCKEPQLMLHCTSTVLNASHHWSSIVMRTGACHGGENGHASLRLSCQWRGSLHRRRNGHTHTQPIGVGENLLSSLPTAAPHVRS